MQGLVKPVVQLVGAAVKILPCKKYFPQEEGDISPLNPSKPPFWNLTGGWHGQVGRGSLWAAQL